MERWNGRVALVTGASVGIGAAICKVLVGAGMKVVGAARGELSNSLKKEKGSLTAVKCDLTKEEDIRHLFKEIKAKFGGVDVCINNAGFTYNKSLLVNERKEVLTMDILLTTGGHRIPNMPGAHFYCGTKFALMAVSEGLRQEMRELKSHIRISIISPGAVETEFAPRMFNDPGKGRQFYSAFKCLQAEDVARSVLHIISAPAHVEINDILMRPTEQAS
ncbi:Dehydrogenase/reductase SDR family member 11 [Armadillidium nasatum]|uniref:Dehydrogenase/reductase SDR family member 11 n=1 Tax=Armadillidium nasatum TaxID=96803 RepID=A0A5N5T3G3_9CRUS|nr:Dehydrogenase/reductase SDR family member 11 [Armadillidium nasatum]